MRILIITVLGLMAILAFALRSTSISRVYGLVQAEIPVMPVPITDPTFHNFEETPSAQLSGRTPVVVMTTKEFFFGDLEAFSSKFSDVRNKFFVRHQDGIPDIGGLLDVMHKWLTHRPGHDKEADDGILVFLPAEEIPSPIVIQTLAGLKKSPLFNRVVLASGIL